MGPRASSGICVVPHPSDINSSGQNPATTGEVLLQIREQSLAPFPRPYWSRQLWYFSKGQHGAGNSGCVPLAKEKIDLTAPSAKNVTPDKVPWTGRAQARSPWFSVPSRCVFGPCGQDLCFPVGVLPVLQPVPALTLLSDPSLVLDSVLPQHMLPLVCSGLKAGMGAAVEFAWCLHYIICR